LDALICIQGKNLQAFQVQIYQHIFLTALKIQQKSFKDAYLIHSLVYSSSWIKKKIFQHLFGENSHLVAMNESSCHKIHQGS
jgi:hypothetical protein